MRKKVLSLLVQVSMFFGLLNPVMAANPASFKDMPDDWSKPAVAAAIYNGLLVGDDQAIFPKANLRRSEMAAIVNRAFGAVTKGNVSQFTDVTAESWYADEMAKAVQMGTFTGAAGKLRPQDPITRQEAFVVLARAFKLTTIDYTPLDRFSDRAQISDWAKPAAAALVSAGYVSGSGGRLRAKSCISRAEFAQVMQNLLGACLNKPGTYTAVPEGNVMISVPGVTLKGVVVKGDLIIGDGVGTGEVTLDGVKVEGRTVVRGGGKNSVAVINGTTINGMVIIDNVNNEVRIVTDQGTAVQRLEAGSSVILEGTFGAVTIIGGTAGGAAGQPALEVRGNIRELSVEACAEIRVTSGSVTKVNVGQTAGGTTINAASGARIEAVIANAQTNVVGQGTVVSVEVKADGVKVDTPATQVTVAQGVTGVTVGGKEVAGGSVTTSTTTSTSTGGGGGDGDTPLTNELTNGYTGDYTASTTGTLGPASGTATVSGSVYLDTSGVTLQNLTISGNLLINSSVGQGSAYLLNVAVEGSTIINGGGSDSIHLQGASNLGAVTVDDKTDIAGNKIRIVVEGTSQVDSIDVKSAANIEDNSTTADGVKSNIGYVKACSPGLTAISGTKADGLIENIIANAQTFIDAAYADKANHLVKDTYASIEMLNDDIVGIHSQKQYLYPIESKDDSSLVPAELQTAYANVQDSFNQLWMDWYHTFPLLGLLKDSFDMNQSWVVNYDGDIPNFARTVAHQQYLLNQIYAAYALPETLADSKTSLYTNVLPGGLDITVENIGYYLEGIQQQTIVDNVYVTGDAYDGLEVGDQVVITFKCSPEVFDNTAWNSACAAIGAANPDFTATPAADSIVDSNLLGQDFSGTALKTLVLTAKGTIAADSSILLPQEVFNLGSATLLGGSAADNIKAPAVDLEIPINW